MTQRILLALLLLLLVGTSAPLAAQTSHKVKIGFITDMTGSWGAQSQIGAKMAARELAEDQWPVEIVFGDHRSKVSRAVEATQKILAASDVDALYVESSPAVAATAVLAGQNKKLFVGVTELENFLAQAPTAVKAYIDYAKGCREIARYWQRMHYQNIGMLKPEGEYGELCEKAAREVFPGLTTEAYRSGQVLSSQLLNLKNKKVEAIFNIGLEADVMATFQAMADLNWDAPLGLFEQSGFTKEVISRYRRMLEGTTVFGFSDVSHDFSAKVKAFDAHGGKNLEATALAYVHIKQLVTAVRSCKSGEIACQLDALVHSPADSLLGFTRFENRIASYESYIEVWSGGSLSLFKSYN